MCGIGLRIGVAMIFGRFARIDREYPSTHTPGFLWTSRRSNTIPFCIYSWSAIARGAGIPFTLLPCLNIV